MSSYLKELYKGIRYSYYIFWDGKAIAVAKMTYTRSQNPSLTVKLLKDGNDLSAVLGELGYAGEGIEVIIYGHTSVQRLEKFDADDKDIPDWVIANKNRIFPPGIDEDDLFLEYSKYDIYEDSYLAICLTKRDILSDIQSYFGNLNLRLKAITPFIGYALDVFGFGKSNDNDTEISFKLPNMVFSLMKIETGYILRGPSYETSDSAEENSILQLTPVAALPHANLYFYRLQEDLLSKIHRLALIWMKPIIRAMVVAAAACVIINLILTAFEVKGAEKLEEYQYLKSNLDSINKQNAVVEEKHELIKRLERHRSNLASYLNEVASEKPNRLWWRKIEYESESGLTIEGFCVGDEGAAVYHNDLAESGYFGPIELSKIEKFTVKEDSRIPSKYGNDVYKFKLEVKGI